MQKTDILIIGSGIAGLFFAMKIAKKRPELSIVIMTKEKAENTNTKLAQGGIAVVTDLLKDSFEEHIQDTLKSGGTICDEETVRMVICQAPERLKELVEIGASFDKNQSGNWDLGLEGGHSHHRILHHNDTSGWEIEKKLLETIRLLPNITLLENHMAIDFNTKKQENNTYCTGAFYYDKINDNVKYIRARVFVLSTGGCGQLFENTTNPEIATGDGIAIASRIGAKIQEMQHIQFHPTALYEKDKNPYFLISEAVRGFGAYIVNENQERFVFKYDNRGELATRDIVSQAISKEMELTDKKHVYLDCRHLNVADFYKHFPSITDYCKNIGIDPKENLIPIVPVAHYQCGGIKVDKNALTNLNNLYAIGECSRTGLHGKNRLASNSLLEALVFAHQASENIDLNIKSFSFEPKFFVPKLDENWNITAPEKINLLKKELQKMMTSFYNKNENDCLSIDKIKALQSNLEAVSKGKKITLPLIEITNMLTVASVIIEHRSAKILSEA